MTCFSFLLSRLFNVIHGTGKTVSDYCGRDSESMCTRKTFNGKLSSWFSSRRLIGLGFWRKDEINMHTKRSWRGFQRATRPWLHILITKSERNTKTFNYSFFSLGKFLLIAFLERVNQHCHPCFPPCFEAKAAIEHQVLYVWQIIGLFICYGEICV